MNKNSALYNFFRNNYYNIKNLPSNIHKWVDTRSIKNYKNKHCGEICFIIGNGPSMTVKDLDKIHSLGIKSFACNKMFLIFDETDWRPDYYFVSDSRVINDFSYDKTGLCEKQTFFPRKYKNKVKKGNFYNELDFNYEKEKRFSLDAYKGVYPAGTVVSEMLHLAYYMGFKKVYIIGVDFSYNKQSVDKKNNTFTSAGGNYFIKGYEKAGDVLNLASRQGNINGFEAAKEAFESNGREIYNATRGGLLEVFERRNLDEVFDDLAKNK